MELKVMSFNVRCANDPDGHSIAERGPRVKAVLEKYSPDLVGVQEYRPAWESCFDEYLAMGYDMYFVPREFTKNKEATPLMWKKDVFEVIEKKTFWMSDTPEVESRGWDEKYDVNRICSYLILKHKETGKKLAFFNTHFGFGDFCQTSSAKLINKYSRPYGDLPTVITGDFNMTAKSAGYKEMAEYFTDVNKVTANETVCTFHGYAPKKHADSHIDFCFVNDKVTPCSFRVITDTFEGKYPSDHYPVLAELKM